MKKVNFMLLLCCALGAACNKYVEYPNTADSYFSLSVADTAGQRNDGASLITLSLTPLVSVTPGLIVTFSTQNGTLLNTSANIDNGTVINTQLQLAQDTSYYLVKAVVMSGTTVSAQKTLRFSLRPACPDFLGYEFDNATLSTATPLTISAFLSRKVGKVSIGTRCYFRSFQISAAGDTLTAGRFTGVQGNGSDSTGKLGPVLFYSDTPTPDVTKMVTLQISAYNDKHQLIKTEFTLGY